MLLQHGLPNMLLLRAVCFLSSDIEKSGQDGVSSTTCPRIGQYDDSIAAPTRRVAFHFAQLGLGDVKISMVGAAILLISGRYKIPCTNPT